MDDLIKRGVLCYEDGNLVRFKSAFFFHYFLALHFDYDADFKRHVLIGDNYLDYTEEIGYYTGLKRDDIEMLNFTQSKLHEAFGEFNSIITQHHEKIDEVLETKQKSQTLAFQIPNDKLENKPTASQMEEVYDNQLLAIPEQKNIPKKSGNNYTTKKNTALVLKLACNVLKNSEDIDDFDAKTLAYKNTLISSISSMIRERDALIIYYAKYKTYPDHIPKNIDFHLLIQIIPLFYQVVIYDWLGSLKLKPVIIDKLNKDKLTLNISKYEKFLSVFIYADVKGVDYPQKIEEFVKNSDYIYLKNLSFLKILSYYHLRNNTAELDKRYLTLLYKIKKDLGQTNKQGKFQFIKNIIAKKKKEEK